MKNKSIWLLGKNNKLFKSLDKDISTDILIIGGGIAGLSTAYFLMNSNYNITLIDKNYIGLGITSNSSAKISFVREGIYHKMKKNIGKRYLDSQLESIKILKSIISNNKINCDFEVSPSYLFTESDNKIEDIRKEEQFYRENDIECEVSSSLPIDFPCKYSIKIEGNYVFNPYKYLTALKGIINKKVKIYEKTRALSIKEGKGNYEVITDNNKITTKIVIVCTQYPFFTEHLFIPFKGIIEKSFLVVSNSNINTSFNAINTGNPTHSIRTINLNNKKYLLYVNNSHYINKYNDKEKYYKDSLGNQRGLISKDIYTWFTNQDLITPDYIPYIGVVKDNLYVATGFNTWGMTNGTISGKVISDMILGIKNDYIELFNPKRVPYCISKLLLFNINNGTSYILSKIKQNYSFYRNVKVITENNKKIGIYIDDRGVEHKVYNICPHLKCNLIFNMVEKTWDCPCHGSRFDIDGNCICGPSVYDIKYKNID